MEKPLGYSPSLEQNKIKKEPEPLINRVKGIASNISRRLQKPEVSTQSDKKDSNPLPKEIIGLAEKIAGKEEVKDFGDFINDKLKNMDRRTFLKIAVGTAAGAISVDYVAKNIDKLWTEFQKEKIGNNSKEFKDLQSSIKLVEQMAEYPKTIEKSEKQTLKEFVKNLSKKKFTDLIMGEYHGFGPTSEKAAYLLEELIKNGIKISGLCFENLSYTNQEHIETTKKFNNGELSTEELFQHVEYLDSKEPLLKLARKYSIEIIGLEKETKDLTIDNWYGRFKEISEKIGEISKKRMNDGILVSDLGQTHVTVDTWKKDKLSAILSHGISQNPPEEEALENNYTIYEYLKKIGQRPIAIQIEDWQKLTCSTDSSLASGYDRLSPQYKKTFYKKAVHEWQNYILKEKEAFITSYPEGKENTFSLIIPSEVPEKPPFLTEQMEK